jgi:NADPH:quinone reductase-like Zn-dependent oxidoreductase
MYEHANTTAQLMAASGGHGVDVILEVSMKQNMATDLQVLASGGRVAVIGGTGEVMFDAYPVIAKGASRSAMNDFCFIVAKMHVYGYAYFILWTNAKLVSAEDTCSCTGLSFAGVDLNMIPAARLADMHEYIRAGLQNESLKPQVSFASAHQVTRYDRICICR